MSRLFFPDPATAADLGVRAITLDRPGIGGSDPQADHRVADWPADVTALADALGIDRFGVIGYSAGVPYALACAALIPERLTGVAVTNSASAMIYLAREDPEVRAAVLDADDAEDHGPLRERPGGSGEGGRRGRNRVGAGARRAPRADPLRRRRRRRRLVLRRSGPTRHVPGCGPRGRSSRHRRLRGAMARAARPVGVPDRGYRDAGPRLAGCQRPDHATPRDAEADGPDPPSRDDRVGRRRTQRDREAPPRSPHGILEP